MSGFTIYYTDGGYTEFPLGGEQADAVVEWFREPGDDRVIQLRAEDGGVTVARKRHITRIRVTE